MEYVIGIGVVIFIFYVIGKTKSKNPIKAKNTASSKPKAIIILSDEFKEILDLLKNSKNSVFITGKAGTGKSSLLQHFIKQSNKKSIVLAPTGVAALNISGQTTHSFFSPTIENNKNIKDKS